MCRRLAFRRDNTLKVAYVASEQSTFGVLPRTLTPYDFDSEFQQALVYCYDRPQHKGVQSPATGEHSAETRSTFTEN